MTQRGKKIDNVVGSKEEVRSQEEILPVVSEGAPDVLDSPHPGFGLGGNFT